MDLRRSLSNRIPYALSECQDEMRSTLAVARTEDLQSLGASWERRGWLVPKLTRRIARGAPHKEDTLQRQAWREQKAKRRALLSLL